MKSASCGLTPVLTAILVSLCSAAFGQDADDLLRQVDRNLMPSSYGAFRRIIDTEPNGTQKTHDVYMIKKGTDRAALLFLAPSSEKDRSMLRVGDNLWLYIPSVGRPIRQTSLQSVTGGIFDNADILALDFSVEYAPSIASQDEGRFVLDLHARSNSVAYAYVRMYVQKKGLIVEKIECHTAGRMLLKTIEFSDTKDFGNGIVRPAVMTTTSSLHEGYTSKMVFTRIQAKEFPDEFFTLAYMSKLKGLAK